MNGMDLLSPALSFGDIMGILFRRRWWLIIPMVLGLIAATVIAMMITPQYRSTAALLIASQEVPTSFVAASNTNFADERIAKIRQQMLSRANLLKLIGTFRLYPVERRKMPMEHIQDLLRNAIEVDLVGAGGSGSGGDNKTIAFSLSFTYPDPRIAHAVAERLTESFITEDRRLRTEQASGTASFLARRGNEIRDRLVDLESQRRELEARYSGALPTQIATSAQAGSALRAEVSRIDAESQGLMQQNSLLAARGEELVATANSGSNALHRAEEKLSQLLAVYSEEHPDVRAARAAVEVERGNAAATSSAPRGAGLLASEIAAGRSRLAMLSQRRAEMVGSISQMDRMTSLAPQATYELNNLERDYTNLKQQYQDIREKQMEAQVAANLQVEGKGERFSIVDPPSLPIEPVRPNRPKIVATGTIGALMLGIAAIAVLELLTGRINGAGALARLTGMPPVVVIPVLPFEEPAGLITKIFPKRELAREGGI